MKIKIAIITLFLLMLTISAADATQYFTQNGYTFICSVRNQSFKDIRDVRVSGFVSGNSARLQFEAPGYQQKSETVWLRDNVTQYRVDVRLSDPVVYFDAKDQSGAVISGVYVQNYQSLYWGDEYGCTFTFPKTGFSKLTKADVEVKVNWFTPFLSRFYFSDAGDNWKVEAVFKRRDLDKFSNRVVLYAKRDAEEKQISRTVKPVEFKEKIRLLEELNRGLSHFPGEVTTGMITVLKEDIETEAMNNNSALEAITGMEFLSPLLTEMVNELNRKNSIRQIMTEK
jgi:hypothetical protein